MPMYINGKLAGMGDAVSDKEYQQKLSELTTRILGDNTSISAKELKKTSLFMDAYKKLDAEGKKRFDAILNLDGDAKNVSEKELKTLLTLLDADLSTDNITNREVFLMDNEITTDKSSGIYQATEKEIQNVYQNTKTRAEQQAEEVAKLKEKAETLNNLKQGIAQFDITTGAGLTKALTYISNNIRTGNSEGMEIYETVTRGLFNGQLEQVDTYRDGGSRVYRLKDGTEIYHNHKIGSDEYGFVSIIKQDEIVEKYNPDGEKVQ